MVNSTLCPQHPNLKETGREEREGTEGREGGEGRQARERMSLGLEAKSKWICIPFSSPLNMELPDMVLIFVSPSFCICGMSTVSSS